MADPTSVIRLETKLAKFHRSVFSSSLKDRKGYRVVSGTVDFCVDDILDKCNCVIGNSMNLRAERGHNTQKEMYDAQTKFCCSSISAFYVVDTLSIM